MIGFLVLSLATQVPLVGLLVAVGMIDSILTTLLAGGLQQVLAYIVSLGGWAAAAVVGIEFLTNWGGFPWLTPETSAKAKRAVSVGFATAGSVGLAVVYDGAAEQLVIQGFTAMRLAAVAVSILSVFGAQELIFRLARKYLRR